MSPRATRAVNLAHTLTKTARRLPESTALVSGPVRWSWRELDDAVGALAHLLHERGVRPGQCVLVHSTNHLEYVQTMFAVWRVGAVLAPTNVRVTPADVAGIARTCRPVALVCHRDFPEHASAVTAEIPLPAGILWIGADPTDEDGVAAAGSPIPYTDAPVRVGAPAWYFFTSGTSGAPKAAILTHDQMGFVLTNHLCDLMPALTERDVSLVVAPLSHGAGTHVLPQVAVGAATVLTRSGTLDGSEVWELVERERVSNMFTVPTILKLLAEHPDAGVRDHSSLRHVIYAGAPMYAADQQHARRVLGDVLVQYYGLGEVTGNITVLPPRLHDHPSPDGVEIGTCGYPRTGMQVSIQDETGHELPAGRQGEICVAGPAVFAGYLNNDAADAAAFRDGWFRTGDLGILDDHGFLYVTGRASDMYICGGSNIYPRDIEEKLLEHPDVSEAAVLGMPDPVWGEVGVAICVPVPGACLDPDELRRWLEPRLARYKLPRHFLLWDELPKSGYGKVVKRTIRSQLHARSWPPARPRAVS
ncbi:AMP-binding protein (plasmid) [Rhodococcus pseudokoreensis]|uniref:AMP-binding protein n=1 Tax=Rhodococcus pseudokoreensis TaxID=2811421 RepID=A0A974VZ07_9NOCA|nr:acyl-CoA synthetase [Rhodococcus pseudokoreensis]QSE87841.1 AMP-binding protein [Rhodococcus pseudokoreensis]